MAVASEVKPKNIFDLERLGLYISTGTHRNVKPCHVYRKDGEGVVELPGVIVINPEQKQSDQSPVTEVKFENFKLTGRGWLAVAGFSAIAISLIDCLVK